MDAERKGREAQVQVQPHAQHVTITAHDGRELALDRNREVVARVIASDPKNHSATLSLAGQQVKVHTDVPLKPNDVIGLKVTGQSESAVVLQIVPQKQTAPPPPPVNDTQIQVGKPSTQDAVIQPTAKFPAPVVDETVLPKVSRQLEEFAPAAIRELAKSGVAVTPQLVRQVASAIERLVVQQPPTVNDAPAPAPTMPTTSSSVSTNNAARAFAALAARDLPLNLVAAERVVASLQNAGQLSSQLQSLAQVSPEVAKALPTSAPTAAVVQSMTSPNMATTEVALSRMSQALAEAVARSTAAASGQSYATHSSASPVNGPTPVVAAAMASSNAAQEISLMQMAVDGEQKPQLVAMKTLQAVPATQGLTNAAQTAAQQSTQLSASPTQALNPNLAIQLPSLPLASVPTENAAVTKTGSGAPAAAGSAASASTSTSPDVAKSAAGASTALAKFVTSIGASDGAPAAAIAQLAKSVGLQQTQQAPAGHFVPQDAGGDGSGGQADLVTALKQALLGTPGKEGSERPGERLAQLLADRSAADVASAMRQLPQHMTLQIAGRLLAELPHEVLQQLPAAVALELRNTIHTMLNQLGDALKQDIVGDDAILRNALQQVAGSDPRPHVAAQAQHLLDAMDGAQVLSTPKAGADTGYVYFQLPLPGQRSAEVLVRREPGRKTITFDQFSIAFLLNTESLGSLMVQLDATPASVSATVRTDRPEIEPFLRTQSDSLRSAVEEQAGRPLTVNVGVFDNEPAPQSLLDLESIRATGDPGERSYYA